MSITFAILLSVGLVSIVSFIGIAVLAFHEDFIRRTMISIVSFATGAILGNIFFHILPEAIEESTAIETTFLLVLGGILFSFCIEKFIHWHHCHHASCDAHVHPIGPLMLLGDGVHNITDGILIATSYLVSVPLGIATTTAVILHELPQEFGDFAILIHSGFSRAKALLYNFLSALTAFLGAIGVLWLSRYFDSLEAVLLPLAAGNLLYIAVADLIPELHKESRATHGFMQLLLMLAGIALLFGIVRFVPEPGHGDEPSVSEVSQAPGSYTSFSC